jgi:hypothetical protein
MSSSTKSGYALMIQKELIENSLREQYDTYKKTLLRRALIIKWENTYKKENSC